jgi:hypothetical protein
MATLRSQAATSLNDWMEELVVLAAKGKIVSTSAGAGPGRDYAYLHYRTDDGTHSVLVFRVTHGKPEVLAFRREAPEEDAARVVDSLTHGEIPRSILE